MIKKTNECVIKECVIINIAMPEVVRVEKEDKEIEKHRSLCREPRRLWGSMLSGYCSGWRAWDPTTAVCLVASYMVLLNISLSLKTDILRTAEEDLWW